MAAAAGYLILMGILDCFLGTVLYIIAMTSKKKRFAWAGLIIQGLAILGNVGVGKMLDGGVRLDTISSIVFFAIMTVITFVVVNKE